MRFKYLLLLLLITFSLNCFGQQIDTLVSTDTSTVRFFEDPAINLLVGTEKPNVRNGKARGYRIQIYNGIDRNRAASIQQLFISTHPGVSAYLNYNQPHFRVRVGDFLSRSEAFPLYLSLTKLYTCMIVPAIVNLR